MPRIGPYTLTESLRWLYRFLLGPTREHAALTPGLPPRTTLHEVEPRLVLAFGGDVMSNRDKALCFEDGLRAFVADADHLVLNLEGILSDEGERPLVKQYSSDRVLDDLAELLPPERLVLSLGNNHAADYGAPKLAATVAKVEARGARVIGLARAPGLTLAGEVYLHGATRLTNEPTEEVATLAGARPDPGAALNILYPHWGEEFVVYPSPEEIAGGQRLLEDWDMILGHHSHCPGPVATYEVEGQERPIAWSLGNFSCFFEARAVRWGVLVKAVLGPDGAGVWRVGRVEWRYTHLVRADAGEILIGLRESCPVV